MPDVASDARSPVLRAVQVLSWLARQPEPASLAELGKALQLPKATLHRVAALLERHALVVRDPVTLRYAIGDQFESLAFDALRNGFAQRIRRLHLDRLSASVGERVNLGVLASREVMYVQWVDSSAPVRVEVKPGTPVPVHCSANGKLLVAFAAESVRRRFLALAPFQTFTPNTIGSARAMQRELEAIRERGYSIDNEEWLDGVYCVAAPVRGASGEVVASLAIMSAAGRHLARRLPSVLPELQACARAISADLGWRGEAGGRRTARSDSKPLKKVS